MRTKKISIEEEINIKWEWEQKNITKIVYR